MEKPKIEVVGLLRVRRLMKRKADHKQLGESAFLLTFYFSFSFIIW